MFLTQWMGFHEHKTEPRLLMNCNIILGMYVDDILVVGDKNEIVKKESGKYKGRWITHTPKVRIHDTF